MPLAERPIPVSLVGLDTGVDPKGTVAGRLALAENVFASRTTGGGETIEVEKRYGLVHLPRTIAVSGSIADGKKLATFGSALALTDGSTLYHHRDVRNEWQRRGRVADISALIERIESNQGSDALDVDCAYANGYLMFTASREETHGGKAEWYLVEEATGSLIAEGQVDYGGNSGKVRVFGVGTQFFMFSWNLANTIHCQNLDTAVVGPIGFASSSNVATNVNLNGHYDVIYDTTNARFVVAYQNTTPALTLMIWTTSMGAGTSAGYATRNPDTAIGFLDHSFSNGSGYVAIGTSASGLRSLTFGSSSMTVTTDTQLDAAATDVDRVTGYFASPNRNVFYTRAAATSYNRRIQGWTDKDSHGAFSVYRSVGLASRCFSQAGKRYVLASYEGDINVSKQNSLFLIELVTDTYNTLPGDISVAGVFVQGNASKWETPRRSVGAVAIVSATKAVLAASVAEQIAVPSAVAAMTQEGLARISLDWSGSLIGNPVEHNDVLYLPGACSKIYDGHAVVENGAHVYPEAPALSASNGGPLTLLKTYKYAAVFFRYDATAKLWESAVSFPGSITLTGTQATVSVTVTTLRLTEAVAAYNVNPLVTPWRIALYRTKGSDPIFRLLAVLDNDVTVDTVNYSDSIWSDDAIASNPLVYTDQGILESIPPPAVLSFAVHQGRLFAICGDGTLWNTHKPVSGVAAQFPDAFRKPIAVDGGPLTGLISLDSTLIVAKRAKLMSLTGEGPTRDGNNPFAYPENLPGETGLVAPRAFGLTPTGALIQSPKGFMLLDRSGALTTVPGADAYESLTITGGVALDDRPFTCLSTSDGSTLVWDWRLKQWYVWTGQAAVAACRWQNKLALLASDGTVKVDTAGTYSDNGSSYQSRVRLTWLNLAGQLMGFQRIWAIQVLAEFLATFTFNLRLAYDFVAAQTSYSISVTSGTVAPVELKPARQECRALEVTIDETSTTAGFKLSGLLLTAGFDGRVRPVATTQRMT
jgi:hypothetical protein